MASTTEARDTEVVKEAEDIVAAAAKSEAPEQVESNANPGSSRAWDARAQID